MSLGQVDQLLAIFYTLLFLGLLAYAVAQLVRDARPAPRDPGQR